MVNYDEIDRDIESVAKWKSEFDVDHVEFYNAFDNVIEYAKEQRELDED